MKNKILTCILLAVFSLCAMISCGGSNEDVEDDLGEIQWEAPAPSAGLVYNALDNGTYEIVDLGACQDRDLVIPEEYQGKRISKIGAEAFKGSLITSVTFLGSIDIIEEDAFENCNSLEKVEIIDICDWLNILFSNKYSNPLIYAKKLFIKGVACKELVVPSNITRISDYSFFGAEIDTVKVPEGVEEIGISAFGEAVIVDFYIPSSLKKINDFAFGNLGYIKNVRIGSLEDWCDIEFTNLGSNPLSSADVFYVNGVKTESIVIPETVTSIGNNAFCGDVINAVTLHNKITSIGDDAFRNTSISRIVIPNSVEFIGVSAFSGCDNLTYIKFADGFKCEVLFATFAHCENLTEVTIPACVKTLNNTFLGCDKLNTVKFEAGSKCEEFLNNTFYGCDIRTMTIPKSVKFIFGFAFKENSLKYGYIYFEDPYNWYEDTSYGLVATSVERLSSGTGVRYYLIFPDFPNDLVKITE